MSTVTSKRFLQTDNDLAIELPSSTPASAASEEASEEHFAQLQ